MLASLASLSHCCSWAGAAHSRLRIATSFGPKMAIHPELDCSPVSRVPCTAQCANGVVCYICSRRVSSVLRCARFATLGGFARTLTFFLIAVLLAPRSLSAYATFTHLELIDLVWNDKIRSLILQKYPEVTDQELEEAHAYAYGGSLIQDLGYYPFGKKFFSNLAHYVRSGDFVRALLHDATNANEFAFAIGALAHFVGDSYGHSEAVNPSTGIMFPDLANKYGPIVSYEDEPTAHVRTEFGFDVAQIGRWRYAPHAYRDHIGFHVSRVLLERAFYETYGLTVPGILGPPRAAIGSYRSSVRHIIPLFAKATIVNVRGHLPPDPPDADLQRLLSNISKTDYAQHWSQYHHGPTLEDHFLRIVIRLVPKIGILKILAIKPPTTQTEALFVKSLNNTVDIFRDLLSQLSMNPTGDLVLVNRDLDTGNLVKPGAYELTDQTYAQLLQKITAQPGLPVPLALRENILAYYSDMNAPISTKKNRKAWQRVQTQLDILRQRKVLLREPQFQPMRSFPMPEEASATLDSHALPGSL